MATAIVGPARMASPNTTTTITMGKISKCDVHNGFDSVSSISPITIILTPTHLVSDYGLIHEGQLGGRPDDQIFDLWPPDEADLLPDGCSQVSQLQDHQLQVFFLWRIEGLVADGHV